MIIATEKVDVLTRHGGAVACQGGDGIIHIERTETFLSQGCTWGDVLNSLGLIASMAHIENPCSRLRDNLYLELTRIVGEYCTDVAEGQFQDWCGKYKNSNN